MTQYKKAIEVLDKVTGSVVVVVILSREQFRKLVLAVSELRITQGRFLWVTLLVDDVSSNSSDYSISQPQMQTFIRRYHTITRGMISLGMRY